MQIFNQLWGVLDHFWTEEKDNELALKHCQWTLIRIKIRTLINEWERRNWPEEKLGVINYNWVFHGMFSEGMGSFIPSNTRGASPLLGTGDMIVSSSQDVGTSWGWWFSCPVVSDSLRPYGLQSSRLLCSRDSPGKDTGVGCNFLLQGIFPTLGLNLCLLYLQVDSLPLGE